MSQNRKQERSLKFISSREGKQVAKIEIWPQELNWDRNEKLFNEQQRELANYLIDKRI